MKYEKHVFVCENKRDPKYDVLGCCGAKGGAEIATRLKKMTLDAGLKGKVRVTRTGCLGECAKGVVIVIYPAETWLTNVTLNDVERIFQEYIIANSSLQPIG